MKKKIFSILFALVLVLTLGLVTAVPAAAAVDEVWVATTGSDTNPGTESQPFLTIQKGVDAVDPDGTVNVAAGMYSENVVIDETLTLQGEDRGTTEIKFGYGPYPSASPLTISADGVTVSGLTIRSGPYIEPSWTIVVEGNSALLTNLKVVKESLKWANNSPKVAGAAVYVTPGLDGFNFTHSIVDSAWNGIYTREGSSNILVKKVDFTYPGEYAVFLKTITGATIEENTFTCTADQYGVIVTRGSDEIEIVGNQFTGSGSQEDSHIGIPLQAWEGFTMGDVTILGNGISGFNTGILVEDVATSGISIHYNNITGNAAYGVNYLGSDMVDATNNWWGSANGPGQDGANDVSGNVLFAPWLKAPSRPTTPMSSFTIDHAKIDFKKKADDDKVRVQGKLDLVNGDDVDIAEDVIVTIGPLSETITMVEKGKKGDRWHYQRPKEDGTGDIKHMTINWKNGKFDIRMDKADLSELTDPEVTISIQIGDDVGEKTIQMRVKKHHWDYKAK